MVRLTISPTPSCSYATSKVCQPLVVRGPRRSRRVQVNALLKPGDGVAVTWDQTTDEVRVKVPVAEGIRGRDVGFDVHRKRLSVRVKGESVLEGSLEGAGDVNPDNSFWVMEGEGQDRHIAITLAKATMGYASWNALLVLDLPDTTITDRVFLEISIDGQPYGRVALGLFGNTVPKTVANFVSLCAGDKGVGAAGKPLHFKGSELHRVIPGFMAQGGDFTNGDGTGGESIYGAKFEDENFKLKHDASGVLAMANAGPNTNGSQFYITYAAQPHLDGKHVVFGCVEAGMEVMRAVEALGSASGKPSKTVTISDCGKLPVDDPSLEALLDFNKRLQMERATGVPDNASAAAPATTTA